MAEQFIEEIYTYSKVISGIRFIIDRFRYQEDYSATELFNELIPDMKNFLIACVDDNYAHAELLNEYLGSIKDIMDMTVVADLLESEVIPIMEGWIQSWVSVDEDVDNRYRIESTATGFLTMKDRMEDIYFHSNNDPMYEAKRVIEDQFDYTKKEYKVWGCGLGYHIYQLYLLSGGDMPITLYEPNPNIIIYAIKYGVLSWIPSDLLNFVSGCGMEEFLQGINDMDGVFILYPYFNTFMNTEQKRGLSDLFLKRSNNDFNYEINKPDDIGHDHEYSYTISLMRNIVEFTRIMHISEAMNQFDTIRDNINKILIEAQNDNYPEVKSIEDIYDSMKDMKDIILIGDVLENALIPILERWLATKGYLEEDVDERYRIESTKSGFLTIKDKFSNKYLHSKNDPMNEAYLTVKRQYDKTPSRYTIWGCGLGYHAFQLYKLSKGNVEIVIYETNPDMVKYAHKYGVLSCIPESILKVIYVNNVSEYYRKLSDYDGKIYLKSYIEANDDVQEKNELNRVYFRYIYIYQAAHELKLNFYKNISRNITSVEEIDHSELKKEMVVIGAGPSLDHHIDTLKKWQGKKTLIAAGTVWKKLIDEGVKPDFVVIMDPYKIVYPQVDGLEDTSARLLFTSGAYWKVADYYKGSKSIIYQVLPYREINDYYKENNIEPWIAGGSVTVFELEFAIRKFADRVYLVGIDLSLPGGVTHATGTNYREIIGDEAMKKKIPVTDVNGNTVYTNSVLIESKNWFELIIAETEGIEFVNMSDIGVRIEGTHPYKSIMDKL